MLENLVVDTDDMIVSRMKDMVEEFISQNSKYEKLDQKVEELEYRRVS
jgi:hypothetical protein